MKLRRFAIVGVLALAGCGYNSIQELDEQVAAMKSNVQTELLRRNDLIPNLVATVEEAAKFEQETFTQVAQARAGLSQATERMNQAAREPGATPAELSQANAAVSEQLRSFINISVEAYPELRANQNFIALQDELTETENRIAVSRRDYNTSVQQYNTYIRRFPQVMTAKVIGADRKDTFEAPESAQAPPRVEFGQ